MSVTIKDVASLSGVSLATASRVLNDKPGVRGKTRERVLAAANSLNYRPNSLAASMITKRTQTIGLLLADIENPFYAEIAKNIEMRARERGYTVIIGNTDNRRALQDEIVENLSQRRVDGFIFASVEQSDAAVRDLIRAGIPCVMYHRRLSAYESHFVGIDDYTGTEQAVRHLVELGHRRIAFVSGSRQLSTGRDRLEAFLRECRAQGVEPRAEYIKEGGFNRQKTAIATDELLRLPEPPTAILAANDLMALQVLDRLLSAGMDVPQQCSVMGFDNIALAGHAAIQLTTIDIRAAETARAAVDLLLDILGGSVDNVSPRTIRYEPRLVVRSTTAPPAKRSERPRIGREIPAP